MFISFLCVLYEANLGRTLITADFRDSGQVTQINCACRTLSPGGGGGGGGNVDNFNISLLQRERALSQTNKRYTSVESYMLKK